MVEKLISTAYFVKKYFENINNLKFFKLKGSLFL